ncbi:MAG: TlpA disulfide reductase family protein [Proteiniphilum sp.]|nr:TlpA disulfide reductase family protein [Proteiniphilum sp.]MDD4415362.1 TlpA disulfide reductase family protein [Proteiniphilum sp.]
MKTNYLLISLLAIFCSCLQKATHHYPSFTEMQEPDKGEKTIVSGRISNLHVYPHVKEIKLTIPNLRGAETVFTSPIDSSGTFRFEIYPLITREITLTPVEDIIVVSPSDSLFIEKDFANITHTVFSGNDAELNRHINLFRGSYLGRYHFPYELPYMEYKDTCDIKLQDIREKLTVFQQENGTSETFNNWAEKQIQLDYYSELFQFPFQHYARTKKPFTEKETYFGFMNDLKKMVDNSIVMADYFRVMELYNMFTIFFDDFPEKLPEKPQTPLREILTDLMSRSDNEFFTQLSASTWLNNELNANSTREIEENIGLVDSVITDPFLRASLQNRFNQVKDFLANPRKYSDAVMGRSLLETSGIGVQSGDSAHIMKRIVEANPNQVLYVDIWATWCPPCIRHMPDSKELSDYFADKPVTFVYLCMGGTEEVWQATIHKFNLSGVHLYLTEKEWQDIMKRFNVGGVPYYLLFDKNGVMVDFGHHLIPGEQSTKIAIEKLLKE